MANEETLPQGAFIQSLQRNNSQIKNDRAIAIQEAAELVYKREVEDLSIKIKQLRRERESMLDLSPTTTMSLQLASEFDEKSFVAKDIEIGRRLRDLEITYEIAAGRYAVLFGGAE